MINYLVGGVPKPSEKNEFVSGDDYSQLNGKIYVMFQSINQCKNGSFHQFSSVWPDRNPPSNRLSSPVATPFHPIVSPWMFPLLNVVNVHQKRWKKKRFPFNVQHFWLVGGFNPSEKYESQWEGLSHILWKNIKCSKPPTRIYIYTYLMICSKLPMASMHLSWATMASLCLKPPTSWWNLTPESLINGFQIQISEFSQKNPPETSSHVVSWQISCARPDSISRSGSPKRSPARS